MLGLDPLALVGLTLLGITSAALVITIAKMRR
jgi:hypothetical protein